MLETDLLVWSRDGSRDQAWEKGRNEGCPRAEPSSAVTRQQRDKGLGKGRNWSPPPASHQTYPQSGPGCPGLVPKNVGTAPTPAPFPATPAWSGAVLQAPGARRVYQRGRGRGRGRRGAERRRLPEPYSRPRAGSAQLTEGAARGTRLASLTEVQGLGRTDARKDRTSEQTDAQ